VPGFKSRVSIAKLKFVFNNLHVSNKHNPHLIPSSYLLSGGGDYRGIYDIGFKRGFRGVYRPFIECPLIG
jgi:hypothetical protein